MGIEQRFTSEQIAEFRQFEDSEIDRFLKKYFPFKETKIWLPEIAKEQFPSVRAETKAGIKVGIDDFLKSEGMYGLSLYVADLTNFVRSKFIYDALLTHFNNLISDKNNVLNYCGYVDDSYRGVIYQESNDLFKQIFNEILELH